VPVHHASCVRDRVMSVTVTESSSWPPDSDSQYPMGRKTKEPKYACMSEYKASHSHKMWTEVSSSAPHLLHKRLLVKPIKLRCLLRVLCLVRRPIRTLDCVLLKDSNLVLLVGLGPGIGFSSLSLGSARTTPHCKLLVFHPASYLQFYILLRDPQGSIRSYKLLNRTLSCELVLVGYGGQSGSAHLGWLGADDNWEGVLQIVIDLFERRECIRVKMVL
jgi:hypothetical protein